LLAAQGAVGAGAALANAQSIAQGLAPSDPVTMTGTTVTMARSYPTADTAGIVLAAGLSSRDYTFLNLPFAPSNSIAVAVSGGSDVNQCYFFYTSPVRKGIRRASTQYRPPDASVIRQP